MSVDTESETGGAAPTDPVHVDGREDLDGVVENFDVVLADFYADWCGPCQLLEPIVETIAAETDATVAKVDVETNQRLATDYGVRGIPTLVLFADGEQVEQVVGTVSTEQLRSFVESYT